eukprot:gene6741-6961_t
MCFDLALPGTAVAAGQPASFYDVLKSDTSHKLIAQAVDADPKTKAMLQKALPVTAFVPTDAAFVVAGIKYKLGTSPADLKKFMSNTCLINAVLKQHIIAGVYDTAALKTISSKPSMLVTQQYTTQQRKMVNAAWPLKFKTNIAGAVTIMSAAVDKNNQPLINAAVVSPANVKAGAISRFVVGPLDVVKIRFQVQLEPITLTHSTPSKLPSHYTGFMNAFKTIIAEEGKTSTIVSFTSGALAGAAATVASYPFDLLRTTLAAQGQPKVYKGMRDAASAIYRHDGLPGLYRGLGVTLIEIMPYAALQFGLYDAFNQLWEQAAARKQRQRHTHQASQQSYLSSSIDRMLDDRKVQAFTCGLAAGLLAKLGSHPLDVAKKRYQVAGLQRSLRYGARVEERVAAAPLLSCLADIYTREGGTMYAASSAARAGFS